MTLIDVTPKPSVPADVSAPSLPARYSETFCSCSFCGQSEVEIVQELKTIQMSPDFGIRHLFHFEETDSTNSKAHELARAGYPEGTLVLADSQFAGRGQCNRTWHSPSGKGIYLSLILRPETSPARMRGITLMTFQRKSGAVPHPSPWKQDRTMIVSRS
jgi:hypothetical protein